MNIICPATYFPSLSFGRPISGGQVYVFDDGVSIPSTTASVNPANLADVFYTDEGGNQIAVSQPLETSKGGVLYYGSAETVRTFYTDSVAVIVAVYDGSGALQYYGDVNQESDNPVTVTNWDLALSEGRYVDTVSTTNKPDSGLHVGHVFSDSTGSNLFQVLSNVDDENGAISVRVRSAGVFGDWRTVWDSSSFTKQSSTSDTTAGAAVLVGGFGLGGYAVRLAGSADSIAWFGLLGVEATATECPTGATLSGSVILNMPWGASNQAQLFIEVGTGNQWQRIKNASWGEWQRVGKTALSSKSANYQLTTGDFGSVIKFSGGTTMTLTIPASIGYDGGLISVINLNSGDLTVAVTGVTLTWLQGGATSTGARTVKTGSVFTLTRLSSTEYTIAGNGIA